MDIAGLIAAARRVGTGSRVYLAGGPAEPAALIALLADRPDLWSDVTVTGGFIPGLNRHDMTRLGRGTRVEIVMPTPALDGANAAVTLLPLAYSAFATWLGRDAPVDFAFVCVTPPSSDGTVGLGPSVDFLPGIAGSAARLIGLVNRCLPEVANGPRLPVGRFEALIDTASHIPDALTTPADAVSQAIAAHVAGLVTDGDTIQIGIGRLPSAVLEALGGHRDLGYHAGMVSEPILPLIAAGVFSRGITAGVAFGTQDFTAAIAARPEVRFAPVEETHGAAALAAIDRFFAINGALEVDLAGRINVEYAGARRIASPGGLPDFVRGARASRGGRSIVALASTSRDGSVSRIVPELRLRDSVAIPAVDFVVTEHGVADLRLDDDTERATRLRAIAAPQHRESLAQAWAASLSA